MQIKTKAVDIRTIALYWAGILLVSSGLLHMGLWLSEGSSLAGPVSLRKPILFGFSAGITLFSLGWVAGKLPRRLGDNLLLPIIAIAMVIEVGLITLQQWRGVPSHFNRETPFDFAILGSIELLILLVSLGIFELTRRTFGKLDAQADIAFAIRGGMVLLSLSCLLGFVILGWGHYQMGLGRSPEIFGAAGVMKFPHGVPMHAIQLLPMLAWFMKRLDIPLHRRTLSVTLALLAMCTFTIYSVLQTFTGRARFDLWWPSGVLLIVTLVFLAPVLVVIASAVSRICGLNKLRWQTSNGSFDP